MSEIPNHIIKDIATQIILVCGEDADALSVREMTQDYFEYGMGFDLKHVYFVDKELVWNQVSEMINRAHIYIEFED